MSRLRIPPIAAMVLFAVVAIAAFIYLSTSPSLDAPGAREGIMAEVNGEEITERHLELSALGNPMASFFSEDMLLDSLVGQRLLVQEAKRLDLTPDESEVEDYLGQLFPGEGEMEAFLATNQLNRKELGREIHQHLAMTAYRGHWEDKVMTMSSDERRAAFSFPLSLEERVHARHILLRADDTTPEQELGMLKEKLTQIKDQAEQGTDFAELAKQYSEDKGSGAQGGDLGWFGRGMMVAPFEEAAFSTPAGAISGIVQSQFGLHLIQVVEAAERPSEEAMGMILEAEMEKLRADSEISIFADFSDGSEPAQELTGP